MSGREEAFVLSLAEIWRGDVGKVGGKNASLGAPRSLVPILALGLVIRVLGTLLSWAWLRLPRPGMHAALPFTIPPQTARTYADPTSRIPAPFSAIGRRSRSWVHALLGLRVPLASARTMVVCDHDTRSHGTSRHRECTQANHRQSRFVHRHLF